MDKTTVIASLRALNPLNLVVSTEPLDVARLLAKVLGKFTLRGDVRAATRFGLMDIRGYLAGDTLKGYLHKVQDGKFVVEGRRASEEKPDLETLDEAWAEKLSTHGTAAEWKQTPGNGSPLRDDIPKADWGPKAQGVLDEVWRQDPKDQQFIYLMPDLWPVLDQPKILAALQRFRDEREVDGRIIKVAFVVVPTLGVVPEAFRPLFDVHYDTGLTAEQAREELAGDFGILKHLGVTVAPEELDMMVKQTTGLQTSEVARMCAYAVVSQRPVSTRDKGLTSVGFAEWRKIHGKPEV